MCLLWACMHVHACLRECVCVLSLAHTHTHMKWMQQCGGQRATLGDSLCLPPCLTWGFLVFRCVFRLASPGASRDSPVSLSLLRHHRCAVLQFEGFYRSELWSSYLYKKTCYPLIYLSQSTVLQAGILQAASSFSLSAALFYKQTYSIFMSAFYNLYLHLY